MFDKVEIWRKDTDCKIGYAFIPEHIPTENVLEIFAKQYSEHTFISLFCPRNIEQTMKNAMNNLVVYSSISEEILFKTFL